MSFDLVLSYGWLALLFFVWVTLSVGSFLNVAIYRLPVMLRRDWRAAADGGLEMEAPTQEGPAFNLMTPRSRCPKCEAPIAAWHNIPLLSWLLLRGRCAGCKAPISIRYPLVELLTAVASILVIAKFGFTWVGAAAVVFTWVLIVLTLIRLRTK